MTTVLQAYFYLRRENLSVSVKKKLSHLIYNTQGAEENFSRGEETKASSRHSCELHDERPNPTKPFVEIYYPSHRGHSSCSRH